MRKMAVIEEKDLGEVMLGNLSPENHINKITVEIYRAITNVNVAFTYLDVERLRELITSVIHLRLKNHFIFTLLPCAVGI